MSLIYRYLRSFLHRLTVVVLLIFVQIVSARADKIAFFYALEADYTTLKEEGLVSGKPREVNGHNIYTINLGSHTVYATKMGSDSLSTAGAAATLLAKFPCDLAISIGPAGRLTDEIPVNEWVNVSKVVAYQIGQQTSDRFIPKGIDFTLSKNLSDSLQLEDVVLASGETFISSHAFRTKLSAETGAKIVDMNLAGLALVCADAHVPLVAWKIVSDSADENASVDFSKFSASYKGVGGTMMAKAISLLPTNPDNPASHPNLKSLLDPPTEAHP